MASYYDELLRLCGFEDDEINEERPRIEKAFHKLELGPEDMKRADAWVRENHDVELLGVRRLLRAWILELVDMVLARDEGKKIVYFGYPSILGTGMAIKVAAPEEIYCAAPDVMLCYTLGQIFNRINPVIEAGEENGLPPGHALCSLLQIRVGGMAKGIIPVPDLILGSSYYCDMGSKADELLRETYGHRAVYIDGSMDSAWGEYPRPSPERVKFLGAQLNKVPGVVKEVLGVEVTPECWEKVGDVSRHFFHSLSQLIRLMMADPMPVSMVETWLALNLIAACTGRAMTEAPSALDILTQEVKQRVDKGIGVVEKGAPRIMIRHDHMSDPRITHMIEQAGLAPCATAFTVPPRKRPRVRYTTPGEIRAEVELRDGRWHSGYAEIVKEVESVEDLNIDGVISSYLFSCRPVALTSFRYKSVAEQTGVPCLPLEMDIYDSRNYSAEALRARIETFAEVLRARKAARG